MTAAVIAVASMAPCDPTRIAQYPEQDRRYRTGADGAGIEDREGLLSAADRRQFRNGAIENRRGAVEQHTDDRQ